MSGGLMSGGRMSGGRLSGGLKSYDGGKCRGQMQGANAEGECRGRIQGENAGGECRGRIANAGSFSTDRRTNVLQSQ